MLPRTNSYITYIVYIYAVTATCMLFKFGYLAEISVLVCID